MERLLESDLVMEEWIKEVRDSSGRFRPLGEEFRRRGTRDGRRRLRGPGELTQYDTRDQGTPIIIVTRSNLLW